MADSNDWYQGVFDVLKSKTISFKMKLWTCLSPQGLYYRNDRAYFWQLVGFRFVEIDAKTFEEVRAIPYLDSEFPVDGPICPSAYNLNGYETILFTGSKSRLIDMKTGKTLQEFPPFRTVVNTGDKVFGVSQLSGQSCDSPDNETTVFNIFENTHVRIKRNFPWGLTSISVVNDEIFTVIDGDRCKKGHFNIIRYN